MADLAKRPRLTAHLAPPVTQLASFGKSFGLGPRPAGSGRACTIWRRARFVTKPYQGKAIVNMVGEMIGRSAVA
ncbi:hypothetical protein [Methylobacterium nigriterrae]|uniref:hypothetical protein n=1 Tax=Methylobacterium nigriterrae TaxID=3127512 RepID=UPI003013B9E3